MKTMEGIKYTRSHEWAQALEDGAVRVGLTDFAQEEMGDIVFLNLPEAGDAVTAGESLGEVESVKAVSDILSPVTGTVRAVNDALADSPESVNADPYGAWLIEVDGVEAEDEMMDAGAYAAFCEQEA